MLQDLETELRGFGEYLTSKKARSPATVMAYVSDIKVLVGNNQPPSYESLSEVITKRVSSIDHWDKASERTKRRRTFTANAFLNFLATRGKIKKYDPFKARKTELTVPKTITCEQFEEILGKISKDNFRGLRDAAMSYLMFNLGLTLSETITITSENIVKENEKTYMRITTGKPYQKRKLEIDEETLNSIRNYGRAYIDAKKGKMENLTRGTFFKNKHGTKQEARDTRRRITNFARQIGISVSPSILRNSYSKRLIQEGITPRQLAAKLGIEYIAAYTLRREFKSGKKDS